MPERTPHVSNVRTLVVKLGTQLLTDAHGRLDAPFVTTIAKQVAHLRAERNVAVTVVSSGAIGSGLAELNLPKRPTDLAKLQAVAAVGQRRLMDCWAAAFAPHGVHVAQILLTREDVDARARYLNVRNTIHAAQEYGAIPIVNENDTISTDEIAGITFGDNDILAATVAGAIRADLLVLLSVVDGLLDGHGKPVPFVSDLNEAQHLVRSEKSHSGKGGMSSKLFAAKEVTESGLAFIVANGRAPDVLPRILSGEELGTLVCPPTRATRRGGRDRWIGSARAAGSIVVDAGCAKAIAQHNKSLLPAGIVKVEGSFARGDVVAIVSPEGHTIARGLTNYAAEDVAKIKGKKTAEVRAMELERTYDEVVHRDNLVVV